MIIDKFNRIINYLRVSVTDKCNFRCVYCMPTDGITLKPHKDILRYESIALIANTAGHMGIKKIRITGGEPLVKKGIEDLVEMLKLTHCFDEITMTTNGSLLTDDLAKRLKANGLKRINISLDTLDSKKFIDLTRGGSIDDVLRGIDAAIFAELFPIKINMVVFENTSDEEIKNMHDFCKAKKLTLQTIKHFSLYQRKETRSCDRPLPCTQCNRLRLTSDGYLKPCLFSDDEIKVDMNNIEKSILKAVESRQLLGTSCVNRTMGQIGG